MAWRAFKREEGTPDAIRYLERFPHGKHHRQVMTELTFFYADKQPKDFRQTETVQKIVDIGMGEDLRSYHSNCGFLVENVFRGWQASGGDRMGCMLWLEQVRRRVEILTPQVRKLTDILDRPCIETSLLRARSTLVTAGRGGNGATAISPANDFENSWPAADGSIRIAGSPPGCFARQSPRWPILSFSQSMTAGTPN